VGAYNDHIEELHRRYKEGHCVMQLFAGQKRSLVVSYCSWPDFHPFVMPRCDVVFFTELEEKDDRVIGGSVIGYVRQAWIFRILGPRVTQVDDPTEHFVCDERIQGSDQQAIRGLLMPTIDEAMVGERGWEAI